MHNRILVTYATRAGSTAEIAETIGEVLAARGFVVDVKPMKEAPPLKNYSAVILGSATRMGSWLTEAVEFVKNNQASLIHIPTAIFTVHVLNTGNDEACRAARQAYAEAVLQLITPKAEAFFAGKIDLEKLSFADRVITKMIAGDEGPKVGDFRDWDDVNDWAKMVFA